MKTSEFRKYLEKKWKFEETEDYFIVHNVVIINKKIRFAIDSPISNEIKLMLEYAKTPLEEREEEKKYNLRLPKPFKSNLGMDYVNFVDGRYMIISNSIFGGTQTQFTQKEIDAMPFDTNFFIKEEVK